MDQLSTPTLDDFSPREREIAELVAAGYSRKSIAQRLGIAMGTVQSHMDRIANKIDGQGRLAIRITRFMMSAPSTAPAA
jgi:DNA-binding NarL/FixJ family response regulator